jgi:hypothetical protein
MTQPTPPAPLDSLHAAQQDMRAGYRWGAPGVATSAAVWAVAAAVAHLQGAPRAVLALLVGGMLIHPVGTLLTKALGHRATHQRGNPLADVAMDTTFWLIFGCLIAYGLSLQRIEWFFQAMLFTIGGRYLVFATVFGTPLYRVLGFSLAAAAWALVMLKASAVHGALAGAVIEAVFAGVLFIAAKRAA